MSYWNPENKKILYFHVDRVRDDFYLKVNVVDQTVWKLNLMNLSEGRGPTANKGLYQLKWVTFKTGFCWDLKPKNIKWIEWCERDGSARGRTKHTTENQWNAALKKLLTEANKI